MKSITRMLSIMAFLFLAMPMIAGAVPVGTFTSELNPAGQTFYGDGAVYGNGFLQAPPANNAGEKCLDCHQGIAADFNPNVTIPDKRSYLRTGHGNMLKKVTAPPQVWRGALGDPYPTTSVGHPINWATGKVDLGGFCDVGGFEGQFEKEVCEETTACTLDASRHPQVYTKAADCIGAGGQWKKGKWTPAVRLADITYLVGDWMSIDAPDTGITGAGLPANKFMMADGRQYGTCGSCHTAGYKANDYTRPQPFADYPTWPRSNAAGIGGSWVLDGIQCERCHDATQHYAAPYTATVAKGAGATALCSQCHIRPANYESTTNNPLAATQPTAYPIAVNVSATSMKFGTHLIGKQFLNSPHGLFTGPLGQIANDSASFYGSRFSDGTRQGGCDTCHDVHQSTIVKIYPIEYPEGEAMAMVRDAAGPEPIRKECGVSCHAEKGDLWTLRHPGGPGTPQAEGKIGDACKSCHMPKPQQPNGSLDLYTHIFRINTNPNYSTFPRVGATAPGICSDPFYETRAECVTAGKSWSLVAHSAPDGDFKNAVWIDLDLACGKCHGPGGEARQMSKWHLAKYAKGIHGVSGSQYTNTAPTAAMAASPAVAGYSVTFVDKSTDAEDPQRRLRIAVNWGDGTLETGFVGTTFMHTYPDAGTYTIRHKVTDTGGLTDYESVSIVISGQ